MPKIDIAKVPVETKTTYPAPYDQPCRARETQRLGQAAGLTQFGVNLVRLAPGSWSTQRHWHAREDEFVQVLDGDVVLVTDQGEQIMHAGDSAGFKAGERNGHHLQNRSTGTVTLLVVGARDDEDWGEYSDIDMMFKPGRYSGRGGYTHKDGTPY
jgi:uncharacterized cupin superfamily protein